MNILVLCTGNSAGSILLESIINHKSAGRIQAYSAGSKPSGKVHPRSISLLKAKEFPVSGLTSQSWDDYAKDDAPKMDVVITVCGSAANETCPFWPGAPIQVHWGVDDPAALPDHTAALGFEHAYQRLKARAEALFELDFETMPQDELREHLSQIGTQY